jgi:hypothetical protein
MAIIRNSAKCATCGVEIVSTHRHDFDVHYCPQDPKARLEWKDDVLVVKEPAEITWNFGVDGGNAYLRRCGTGWVETSEFTEDGA